MQIGAPAASKKHLLFKHQAVDSAAPLEGLVRVILLGVGHGAEEDRHAALACSVDRPFQIADDVMEPNRRLGHLPVGSAFRKEVVDGVDDQQHRSLRRQRGRRFLLWEVGCPTFSITSELISVHPAHGVPP